MKRLLLSALVCVAFPAVSSASGYRPPAHSQLSYSFTCPSGASGHFSYTKDFVAEPASQLRIWINGKYVHEDAQVVAELNGKVIEKIQASCEGDRTVLFLQTFASEAAEGAQLKAIVIFVDKAGGVTSVQPIATN